MRWPRRVTGTLVVLVLCVSAAFQARADDAPAQPITYAQALARARSAAPDLAVARGRETVARAEVGVARTYPNPSLIAGTSTQAARVSLGASVPLVVLGQRGAATRASEAELETVKVDTAVAWNAVRASTARAFVALWLAQRTATERADAARIAIVLDEAVRGRVELGAAPEVDGLRAHAERLRAQADARQAELLVAAAATELARWLDAPDGSSLRADGDPGVPSILPSLAELGSRVTSSPTARREDADARAAEARVARERAFVRPTFALEVGTDIGDPSLSATNYRAQLAFEVPLFNQRGAYVERETASAAVSRTRARAERVRLLASLEVAYRTFQAASERSKTLAEGVVVAADAAARATEESYTLGRAQLVAVLDAERARIESRLALSESLAVRANAWIDVEHAAGLS